MADFGSGLSSGQPQIDANAISSMSSSDRQELEQFLQNQMQKSAIQESIHELTAMCFKKCVTGTIRDNKLDRNEEPCVQNCVLRFMDANMTVLKHLEKMRAMG